MELVGERLIPASILATWQSLNDAEFLKSCIAGCESLDWTQPDTLAALLVARIGPISARFKGTLKLSNMLPPHSYVVSFEGQGGIAGFGKGSAEVSLTEEGAQTLLRYSARAQVGGRLAQVGSRLVDAAASKITEDFFSAFEDRLRLVAVEPTGVPPHAAPGKTPASATSRQVGAATPKTTEARLHPAKVEATLDQPTVLGKVAASANSRPTVAGTPMKLRGERLVPAPLFATFNALNNADSLKSCIFGCESLDQVRVDNLTTVLALGIGPVKARMRGTLQVRDLDIPSSYVLAFEGPGGTKGAANISLIEEGRKTRVRYVLEARIRGPLSLVGSTLIEVVSAILVKLFFSAFEAQLRSAPANRSAVQSKTGFSVK
ncbi:SRPBCC domain-containing protein [Variovorax sp. LjRoot290]|uniref:CoxG family protein n=1 Tax=Variovorax sp. LjRoot290 TaxID=3342316 RepID=UPI003ECF05FC